MRQRSMQKAGDKEGLDRPTVERLMKAMAAFMATNSDADSDAAARVARAA